MIFMYMYSVHVQCTCSLQPHIHTVYMYESHFSLQQVVSLANDVTSKTTCSTVQYSKYISVFPENHFRGANPCSNSCEAAYISDLHLHTSTQFQGTNTLSRKKNCQKITT